MLQSASGGQPCHLRSLGLYARFCDVWVFTNDAHKGCTTDCFRLDDKVMLNPVGVSCL